MGIYPQVNFEALPDGYLKHTYSTPDITRVTIYQPAAIFEERKNCFCCSCPPWSGSDMFCRNHGWEGTRPCEIHNMPGSPDEHGLMPVSVQAQLRHYEELAKNDRTISHRGPSGELLI